MKIKLPSFFFCCAVILSTSCNQVTYPDGGQLAVTWKVISNEYADQPAVKACFTIENKSNFTLNAANWALFYNQSPRTITGTKGLAEVTHISGDWFKLSPKEGFTLKPGDATEINYEAEAWWIKESDAPQGPYFVFYDKEGMEVRITTASNFHIEPFVDPEQINRYRNDAEVIPTPESRYQQNRALSDLSPDKLPVIIPTPVQVKLTGKKITYKITPDVLYEKGLESLALSRFASVPVDPGGLLPG